MGVDKGGSKNDRDRSFWAAFGGRVWPGEFRRGRTLQANVDLGGIPSIHYSGAFMQYMMLIYLDENSLSESVRDRCYADSAAYARQLHETKKLIAVAPLQPTATATSIRHQEGRQLVTDGPFAETREQLGGFFMVDARDLDEAIEIAGRIPAGRWGTVEIRPVVQIPGLPAGAAT